MNFWDINFTSLVRTIVPVRLRQSNMLAWLGVLVSPVVRLYNLFTPNRAANLYNLAHDGQVCYLQAVLNDTFDNTARGIYISDAVYIDPLYVYLEAELKPVWVGLESEAGSTPYPDPQWVYTSPECYDGGGLSFIVHVPVGVVYDLARMKALIQQYKLVGKRYSIVTP